VKFGVGVEGILQKIQEFKNNKNVWGYIHYVIIQPEIPDAYEVKIVCFNGKHVCKNLVKRSNKKGSRSPFKGIKDSAFFDFAETVIAGMRRVCPALVADQVLRIDIFGFRRYPGLFIVNEIEGYEAQVTGSGLSSSKHMSDINTYLEAYWENQLTDLIEYYLAHVNDK
jgi:hypothetical protein